VQYKKDITTTMWADAQRDARPAEYRYFWPFFASCIFSEPRAAHFRHAF